MYLYTLFIILINIMHGNYLQLIFEINVCSKYINIKFSNLLLIINNLKEKNCFNIYSQSLLSTKSNLLNFTQS